MPRSHSMSLCWCSGCAAASRIAASIASIGACASTPYARNVRHVSALLREQRAIQLEARSIGIAVDDAGDADGVVVGEQLAQPVRGGRPSVGDRPPDCDRM